MISFVDRLWLAWKVLTGRVSNYRADAASFRLVLDFTAAERTSFAERVRRYAARRGPQEPGR